jgi:hypothetical protein
MEDKLSFGTSSTPQIWPRRHHVRSLHEFSKNASVGEGQGRTKGFSDFLCIWIN